jgi:hypothetical protein
MLLVVVGGTLEDELVGGGLGDKGGFEFGVVVGVLPLLLLLYSA